MNPELGRAFAMLITDALEQVWRAEFHAGPRGGLKLKSEKGGAK